MWYEVPNAAITAAACDVVERVGQPQQLVGGAAEQLRHAARDRHGDEAQVGAERLAARAAEAAAPAEAGEEAERAIAGRPLGDALADGVHAADDLEARACAAAGTGKRETPARMSTSRWLSADAWTRSTTSPGPGSRVGHVLDAQHLGPAELVEAQGSHGGESGR